MNTSLFVGLCEGARLKVDFCRELIYVHASNGILITTVDEAARAFFGIDTYGIGQEDAIAITEIVAACALTPIEERE